MLRWATIFLAIPLLVAIVGAGDGAASVTYVATILFAVSLGAFIATFFIGSPDEEDEPAEGGLSN